MVEYMRNIHEHRRLYKVNRNFRDVIVVRDYQKACTAFASFCYGSKKDSLGDVLIKCHNGLHRLFPNMYSICIYAPVGNDKIKLQYETGTNNPHKIRILRVRKIDGRNNQFFVGILNHNAGKKAYLKNFLLY